MVVISGWLVRQVIICPSKVRSQTLYHSASLLISHGPPINEYTSSISQIATMLQSRRPQHGDRGFCCRSHAMKTRLYPLVLLLLLAADALHH